MDIREVSVKLLQRKAFMDVNTSSIGLKFGKYGGKKRRQQPRKMSATKSCHPV
jgi:hypothetical protein